MIRRLASARIGFVSARPGYWGPDGVFTDAGLGRLIDEMARRCGTFEVALAATAQRGELREHRLAIERQFASPLPPMPTLARGFWKISRCREVITELEGRCDALVIQLPFAAPLALTRARGPRLYQICADVRQHARTASGYSGLKRIPALAVGGLVDRIQKRLVGRPGDRTVTHGEHLLRHYRARGRAVVSSTLFDHEILSSTRRRPIGAPFRILFVGYLRHEKGIDTLLEAYARVRTAIPDAELVVVGGRDMADTGVDRLLAGVAGTASIHRIGALPFGAGLFQHFADADVLVLPSRSEGTPRVLVEARAFGCPVVASRIGGVPTSVEDGVDGILFPVGDAPALAERILALAKDPGLRARIVRNGIERARRTTVEAFANELLAELEDLIHDSDRVPARTAIPRGAAP